MYIILTRARWAESLVAKRTQSLYTEIEARKQIAEALEESRQRFQAIFDEAATGIVQTDLIGKILDSNKAMQVLFDYSKEELQDRLLKELAHPEDAESDKPMLEKMLSGYYNSYATSKRYHDKYGNVVWTNQSCSIVRDTKNPFIISMIEDITERKCAEQARLEAEKKYRDIFENAVEGIFQCTPTGYFLSVNPAFVKMLGYSSAQQMLAEVTNIGQQLYVNPDQRLEFIKLLEKHSEVKGFEYEARCRDGQMIWVNETARVVRDEQGGIRYYESIV
jgi:PAS domain S-box-containing protein